MTKSQIQKKWRDSNLEKCQSYDRNYHHTHKIESAIRNRATCLRLSYGITVEDYNALFEKQHGLCAICGQPEISKYKGVTKKLSVDHNHKTGKVRELLCAYCNFVLGYSKDNPLILEKAIMYLVKHGN